MMNDETVLSLDKVSKTFSSGDRSLEVLKQSSFNARAGESIAVVGPSEAAKRHCWEFAPASIRQRQARPSSMAYR